MLSVHPRDEPAVKHLIFDFKLEKGDRVEYLSKQKTLADCLGSRRAGFGCLDIVTGANSNLSCQADHAHRALARGRGF